MKTLILTLILSAVLSIPSLAENSHEHGDDKKPVCCHKN